MTQQELIKQLEDTCLGLDPIDPLRLLVDDVIAALAQTEQDHIPDARKMVTEQEPVAIKRMKEWIEYLKRKSDFGQHMKIPSEMSAGTCWELAIELEQFINTTPPQRSESSGKPSAWVGLTDEQITQVIKSMPRGIKGWMSDWDLYEFSKAIEAKLREKNSQHKEKNT